MNRIDCIREVAEREIVPVVDLEPVFAAAEERGGAARLVHPGGHCTPAGYDLVAREVAAAISGKSRPPRGDRRPG